MAGGLTEGDGGRATGKKVRTGPKGQQRDKTRRESRSSESMRERIKGRKTTSDAAAAKKRWKKETKALVTGISSHGHWHCAEHRPAWGSFSAASCVPAGQGSVTVAALGVCALLRRTATVREPCSPSPSLFSDCRPSATTACRLPILTSSAVYKVVAAILLPRSISNPPFSEALSRRNSTSAFESSTCHAIISTWILAKPTDPHWTNSKHRSTLWCVVECETFAYPLC